MTPEHVTLLFDGCCGFCAWAVRLIGRLDRHHRVTAVPYHFPEASAQRLAFAQYEPAAWAVTADGLVPGAGAISAAISAALGSPLPLWLYRTPGLRALNDRLYGLVARNRRCSGTR
ncbi:MAG: thiol-disulfide oxidoreductase DCC family protein [Egibacteraceae bacterium]